MSLFFNYPINEAEIDGEDTGANTEEDYTATADENEGANQPNPQPNGDDENSKTNENEEQDDPSTDYTTADDEGNDDSSYSSSKNDTQPQPAAEVDELKQQEEEMLNSLSPEQLDIKHKELKNQFLAMFDTVVGVSERVGDAVVDESDISVIGYITTTLAKMKDMISDYINSVYQTKSYIENLINYNRFIAVLNGINKILEELSSKNAQN